MNEATEGQAAPTTTSSANATPVHAKMPGVVLRTLVKPGDQVSSGDALLVLEAMKMEVAVAAPTDGTVQELLVEAGQQVTNGQELATLS